MSGWTAGLLAGTLGAVAAAAIALTTQPSVTTSGIQAATPIEMWIALSVTLVGSLLFTAAFSLAVVGRAAP